MTLRGQTDDMRLRRCGSKGGGEFLILDDFPRLRNTSPRVRDALTRAYAWIFD